MKIVLLSFSDYKGGANIAAYKIYKSLKKKNIKFLTLYSKKKDSIVAYEIFGKFYINVLRVLEKIIIKIFLKKKFHQSLNIFKSFLKRKINKMNPDILNIHWINRSTISLGEIQKLNCKILISLHDMWFLNSTEHYFLKNYNNKDLISAFCFNKKKELVKKDGLYFVAHNRWMLNKFKTLFPKFKSKIFLCNYYPIDINLFKPRNKIKLRKKYKIPLNKKIILFSAQDISDYRKGYKYFLDIVTNLKNNNDIFFLSIGKNFNESDDLKNLRHLNFMSHEKISEIYSLADIFICTSIIDNLPLTILEALSSGNVVFSFENGGAKEILKKIGFSFKFSEKNKLLAKLKKITSDQIKIKSKQSRKFALKHLNKNRISQQYINIFKKINQF